MGGLVASHSCVVMWVSVISLVALNAMHWRKARQSVACASCWCSPMSTPPTQTTQASPLEQEDRGPCGTGVVLSTMLAGQLRPSQRGSDLVKGYALRTKLCEVPARLTPLTTSGVLVSTSRVGQIVEDFCLLQYCLCTVVALTPRFTHSARITVDPGQHARRRALPSRALTAVPHGRYPRL